MIGNLSIARSVACSAAVLPFILAGCGGGNHHTTPGSPNSPSSPSAPSSPSTPATPLSVTAITPAPGAADVALNTSVQIVFSSAADPKTVNSTSIQVTDPKAVAGAVTYNATANTATFTPTAPLVANSTYTVTVSGVTDSSGTGMAGPFTSSFATVTASPGGGGSATMQYHVTLYPDYQNPGGGEISIDSAGSVTVQLTGAKVSTALTVQFCPTYNIYSKVSYSCFNVGNLSTDSSGNASTSMKFPQAGSWAGEFNLDSGTTTEYSTGCCSSSSQVYMSTLQPDTTVNGKGLDAYQPGYPQAPLSSGTVSYSKGSLQFTLNGASPNTLYTSVQSAVYGGSEAYVLYNSQGQSAFTTDSKGDVNFSVLQDGAAGDVFDVEPPSSEAGYIGGFSVPK